MNRRPRKRWAILAVAAGFALLGVVIVLLWTGQPTPAAPPPEPAVESAPPSVPEPPPPPGPAALAPVAAPAAAGAAHPTQGEAALMERLRQLKDKDPAAAIGLAREGNQRFPDTGAAAERASILIHALAAQSASSEARGEAEDMVNRYADDRWVREIEAFTGAHRHRNFRVNDAGQIEAYDPPGVGPAGRDR